MTPLSIAIVGAGASGCYAAQALRKEFPDAEITVLERLPVPFGLLRYGVAADHQGTKGVQQQFERMFERSDVAFIGGVDFGRDIQLDRLGELFDIVVLATGVPQDRLLDVEGDTLAGVIGAGRLTRALNSHPEDCATLPTLASKVAVVGSGNVAVDIVRLLSKDTDEWGGSDMDNHILGLIVAEPVSEIHLISRASAEKARWEAAMIRELASLKRPVFRLATGKVDPSASPAAKALADLLVTSAGKSGSLVVNFHFASVVERIIGTDKVDGIRIMPSAGNGIDLAVDTVLTAIGFKWRQGQPNRPGVYTTGWLRTGPQGTIPYQRTLAKQLASEIAADIHSGLVTPGRPGRSALALQRTTDFYGWSRIDELERRRAAEQRSRRKIIDIEEMYAVAVNRGDRTERAEEIIA